MTFPTTSDIFERVDNIGLLVRHGFDVAWAYERLGFAPCPLGRQTARPVGEDPVPQGTGSRCLNFARNGYIELIGIVEPDLATSGYAARLANDGPGPAKITLGWNDADDGIVRLAERGQAAFGPSRYDRTLTIDGESVTSEMELTGLDAPIDPLMAVATRHRQPARTFHPRTTAHPNGAVGLGSIRLHCPDPAGVMAALGAPDTPMLRFPGGGCLEIEPTSSTTTSIASIGVDVVDLRHVDELLRRGDVSTEHDTNRIRVIPDHEGAVPIEFRSLYDV
ncbi:MAG: VOC family protein [Actinomycetota bacterium]